MNITRDAGKTYINYLQIKIDFCKFLKKPQANYLVKILLMEGIAKGATYFNQKCPLQPVLLYNINKLKIINYCIFVIFRET